VPAVRGWTGGVSVLGVIDGRCGKKTFADVLGTEEERDVVATDGSSLIGVVGGV